LLGTPTPDAPRFLKLRRDKTQENEGKPKPYTPEMSKKEIPKKDTPNNTNHSPIDVKNKQKI
jgi:hypothetical protein